MSQQILKELAPKFVKDLENKRRSPSTILAYRADLDQLVEFLIGKNKVLADQATQTDIESFRDTLLTKKYTAKTVSRKLNAVKSFYRWLISEHVIFSNPTNGVSHPKIESNEPKFLTPMEYRALRDVVKTDIRIASIVELILQTGIRISEIANLKVNNIKGMEIVTESHATQKERVVPMNRPSKEALDKYMVLRPQNSSPFVFVSKNGKPLAVRNIRASVDRFMQKADIPQYSINDLRTTFIIENLKAGVDLVLISKVAGHKRLSTTEHYLTIAGIKESGKKQLLEEL